MLFATLSKNGIGMLSAELAGAEELSAGFALAGMLTMLSSTLPVTGMISAELAGAEELSAGFALAGMLFGCSSWARMLFPESTKADAGSATTILLDSVSELSEL